MPLNLKDGSLIERLKAQPETGMGYQSVTVVLKDGRRFERVIVTEGQLSDRNGVWEPPFCESEIDELVVTHDRSGPPIEGASN